MMGFSSVRAKLRTYLARRLGVPSIEFSLERLSRVGFHPEQIFDVGAYQGDFARSCLRIFPGARVACFEVLEDRVRQLRQLAAANPAVDVFPCLLGAESRDRVEFHEGETASSVLSEHFEQNFKVRFHPMRTVDSVVREHFGNRPPDLLKLDVQGYELEVIKGAEGSLPGMQMILAEVNLLDIHQGVPLLSDIVKWLEERNWVAYDVCGLARRPLDQTLWQADMIFVPYDSKLRSDKRWAV